MLKSKIIEGFVFAIISENQAIQRLKQCRAIYRLHSDNTESLIEDENDINDTIKDNDLFVIEVGSKIHLFYEFLKDKTAEKTNFSKWLDIKVNKSIIL